MKNSKLVLISILNALGTTIYIGLIALIMQNGEKIFGQMSNLFGPIAFLLLFVLSAAITGALVLGRPVLMYLENQKKEALKLFFYTLGWLLIMIMIILAIQILK